MKVVGSWLSDASWNKSQYGLANNPGSNVGGSTSYIDVYGIITRNGNLSLGGSSLVKIYDTLWVAGDLIIGGGSSLSVEDSGLLVVEGDLRTEGGTLTVNKGRIVAKSNVRSTGSSEIENAGVSSNAFYVFGSITRSGGAEFNGSRNEGDGYFLSEADLYNNDQALYNYVMTGSTLPVEFTYVNAAMHNEGVMISWGTSSEHNNDYFTVEKSSDGVTFQEIAKIQGAGNSAESKSYSVIDVSVQSGLNYYRVKQTDFDGEFEYSRVVSFFNDQLLKVDLNVFPNPASNLLNIILKGVGSDDVNIEMADSNGMTIYTAIYQSNFDHQLKIDVSTFNPGVYNLILSVGSSVYAKKVIVQ